MNSLALEIVRIGLRYVIAALAAWGAPEALTNAVGDPAVAQWLAIGAVALVTESGWIKAKINRAQ